MLRVQNNKVVYIPSSSTPELQSFFAGLLDFRDSHVNAPWFGANYWSAIVTPRPRGGIPAGIHELELKMEFKDGGSFDFHTAFVRLKELATQQAEVEAMRASETGDLLSDMSMPAVNLEQLPAYEESATRSGAATEPPYSDDARSPVAAGSAFSPGVSPGAAGGVGAAQASAAGPPAEPPPGYEEVQRESVAYELERSLRRDHPSGSTY